MAVAALHEYVGPLSRRGRIHDGGHSDRSGDVRCRGLALIYPTPLSAAPPVQPQMTVAALHEYVGPLSRRGRIHDGGHSDRSGDVRCRGLDLIYPTPL